MLSNITIDLSTIINIVIAVGGAAASIMLRSIQSNFKSIKEDFKEAMKTISKHEIDIAVLKERVDRLEE